MTFFCISWVANSSWDKSNIGITLWPIATCACIFAKMPVPILFRLVFCLILTYLGWALVRCAKIRIATNPGWERDLDHFQPELCMNLGDGSSDGISAPFEAALLTCQKYQLNRLAGMGLPDALGIFLQTYFDVD